ncbi:MAG: hypothetical protein WCI46_14255 [Verrucomicrobiota bacterium]
MRTIKALVPTAGVVTWDMLSVTPPQTKESIGTAEPHQQIQNNRRS